MDCEIMIENKKVISKEQTYQGEFHWITQDLIKFYRHDSNQKSYSEIDTNPDHWAYFQAFDLKPGQVQVLTSKGIESLSGDVAVWFPKFSIIEWRLSPGDINWTGFLSRRQPPAGLPTKAIAFELKTRNVPGSKEDIFSFVMNAAETKLIEREQSPTVFSEKIKNYLQAHFKEDVFIGDLAKEFSVSHEYITKTMRKCYGITPVYLRSRLRVFSALISLLEGEEVTKVATDCGFNDVNRFTKQFTKMMKTPPVTYLKNSNRN